MDKDKPHQGSGSSPPSPGKCSVFSPPKQGHFGHEMPFDSSQFSLDISRMPDNPPKNLGHRRAHSEILTVLDDISFDSDLGVVGGLDEIEEDLVPLYLDMDKFNSTSESSAFQVGDLSTSAAAEPGSTYVASALSQKPRIRHQHSQSMDGSTTINPEMLMACSEDPCPVGSKKPISAANLAELALVDPKRAKRIWANRQSAARSKQRKMRYIAELERKVQTLQTEATSLSTHFTLLQRDTSGLASENGELKLQLQTIEQQLHLQDALNDALKEEIQHLKVLTGQTMPNGGPLMSIPTSYGAKQQYYNNNHVAQTLITAQKLQQLHLHCEKQ